jgi:putative glutamine amidotransferase
MRLVSAIFSDGHPFDQMSIIDDYINTSNPDDLKAGDVLVVWGGADIHPSLYNKGRSRYSGADNRPSRRDLIEWALMQRAKSLGVPIIGVCRGAQMLCALEGGILAQHVDNHSGYHDVVTSDNEIIEVNSIHHQMMVPTNTVHEMVAWTPAPLSQQYHDDFGTIEMEREPEFIYFNAVRGFAVQWHPEMMELSNPANQYVLKYIQAKLEQ